MRVDLYNDLTNATQLHIMPSMDLNNCLPKDCRRTKIRHAIMGIFIHQQKPLAAAEILDLIKNHVSNN